jgi:hypothetical protein
MATRRVLWNHLNSFDWATEDISLWIENVGVDQAIPSVTSAASSSVAAVASPSATIVLTSESSSTSPIVASSTPRPISLRSLSQRTKIGFNEPLDDLHPANEPFRWSSVNLPEGRYFIRAYANSDLSNDGPNGGSVSNGGLLGTSAVFSIIESPGSTDCLAEMGYDVLSESVAAQMQTAGPSGTASVSAGSSAIASPSVSAATGGAVGNAAGSTSSKTSAGTIAGIVVGVVGGLAILAAFFLFWRKRRRNQQNGGRSESYAQGRGMGGLAGRSRSRSANRLSSYADESGTEHSHVQVTSFESGEKYNPPPGSSGSHGEEMSMTAVLEKSRHGSFLDDGSAQEFLTPLPSAASSQLPVLAPGLPITSSAKSTDAYGASDTPSSGDVTPTQVRSRPPSLTTPPRSPAVEWIASNPQPGSEPRRANSSGMQRKPSVGRRKPVPQIDDAALEELPPRRPSSPTSLSLPERKSYILTADPPRDAR